MAKTASKKSRIIYKEDPETKAAELEAFLFGGGADAAAALQQQEGEEREEALFNALTQHTGGAVLGAAAAAGDDLPLFFEDKQAQSNALEELELDAETDSEHEAASGDAEDATPSGAALRASGSSASASEGGDDSGDDSDSDKLAIRRRKAAATAAAVAAATGTDSDEDNQPAARPTKKRGAEVLGISGRGRKASTSQGLDAAARRPAWEDEEEEKLRMNVKRPARLRKLRTTETDDVLTGSQYVAALRKQHAAMHATTAWARLDGGETARLAARRRAGGYGGDSDVEDEGPQAEGLHPACRRSGDDTGTALLQRAGGLLAAVGTGRLPAGTLEVTRLRDANQHDVGDAVVRSIDWHPNGQLLLTAGMDKKLRVFQVDGVRNPKVQSLFLEDCPITKACFALGGSQVVSGGRRPFFYASDLESGKVERIAPPSGSPQQKSHEAFVVSSSIHNPMVAFLGDQGYVPLVSLRSRQWAGHVKMSGTARAAAFGPDDTTLLTSGGDGLIHTWDLRTRRCVHQMVDEGNIGSSIALAMSAGGRFLATGSSSGVVNVYRGADALPSAASRNSGSGRSSAPPVKVLMHLTTAADTVTFNHDAQVLAIASRMSKDALRLVHLPSLTVFNNWPTSRTPLGHVHCTAFSPGGGLLAVGNAKGKALLYRLHHYPAA